MKDNVPTLRAATLILFRERDGKPPEHLMIERGANMSFAAGALVFPGGRVDDEDSIIAADAERVRNAPAEIEDAAARVAAIRETIEETGVVVAVNPIPSPETILAWRAGLAEGQSFAAMLAEAGATLDLGQLVPFARWWPKLVAHKRFDTRFYLARMPHNSTVAVDGGEATRYLWMTARGILLDAEAGHHQVIFPTRRNLERLAQCVSFDAAVAHAEQVGIRTITPWIQEFEGEQWLCIPDDAGYPVTRAPLKEVTNR